MRRNYFKENWMKRAIVFSLAAVIVVLTMSPEAEAKKGFSIGLGAAYNTIQGDFDGMTGLQGGTEVIILPDVNNAVGIDILAAYGITDEWAIELNLMSSGHNGSWQGMTGDVSYTSFSINGKYSVPSPTAVHPYLLFGISNNVLLIKNGSADLFTGEVGDATLTGTGINLGTGIDYYFDPKVSLNLGIMYRYVDYTSAEGVHGSGTIEDGVSGNGFSFLVTTAYHF
jgi:opacity protein-like surface antigen